MERSPINLMQPTNRNILVIEDSVTQAMQIRALLIANNLLVTLAFDGADGLEKALEILPGLIISDFEMPLMNGVEVARALKNNPLTRDIPIILFTGHTMQDALQMGLGEGIVEIIPKDAFAKVVMVETLKQLGFIQWKA